MNLINSIYQVIHIMNTNLAVFEFYLQTVGLRGSVFYPSSYAGTTSGSHES